MSTAEDLKRAIVERQEEMQRLTGQIIQLRKEQHRLTVQIDQLQADNVIDRRQLVELEHPDWSPALKEDMANNSYYLSLSPEWVNRLQERNQTE